MPHAVEVFRPVQSAQAPKAKASSSRELRQLHILYGKTKYRYQESRISNSINELLNAQSKSHITRLISLGLGSLKSADQSRRIKQLVIFLSIADQLRQRGAKLDIYAQDPSFSRTDEAFLQSLGVQILSTPSPNDLGEAAQFIDESTLVYSPFLTLEAYELLFSYGTVKFFIGDDFDALRTKWPKHSVGRNEAESLSKRFVQGYRRRKVAVDEIFWDEEEKPFPMAMYFTAPMRH